MVLGNKVIHKWSQYIRRLFTALEEWQNNYTGQLLLGPTLWDSRAEAGEFPLAHRVWGLRPWSLAANLGAARWKEEVEHSRSLHGGWKQRGKIRKTAWVSWRGPGVRSHCRVTQCPSQRCWLTIGCVTAILSQHNCYGLCLVVPPKPDAGRGAGF